MNAAILTYLPSIRLKDASMFPTISGSVPFQHPSGVGAAGNQAAVTNPSDGRMSFAPYHTPRVFFEKDTQGNEVPLACQALLRELRKFHEAAFPNHPAHRRVVFSTPKSIEDDRKNDYGIISTLGLTGDEIDENGQPYVYVQLTLDRAKLPDGKRMKGDEFKKANEYLATFLYYAFHEMIDHALPRATRLHQGKEPFLEETEHRKFYHPGGKDLHKNPMFRLFVMYLNATNERFEKLYPEELREGLIKAYKRDVNAQIGFAFIDNSDKRSKYLVMNYSEEEKENAFLFWETLESKDVNDPIWSASYRHPTLNVSVAGDQRSLGTMEYQLRSKLTRRASDSSGMSFHDPSTLQFDDDDQGFDDEAKRILKLKEDDNIGYSSGSPSGYEGSGNEAGAGAP